MTNIRTAIPAAADNSAGLLRKVVRDPENMVNSGTLLLTDVRLWDAGLPAASGRVVNLAQKTARTILANPTAEVRPQWIVGANQAPANSIFERTAKGGLHGIISKVDTGAGRGAALSIPAAIAAYLLANPANDIYVSLWMDTTRTSGGLVDGTTPPLSFVGDSGANAFSNYTYALRSRITRPTTSSSPAALGARPGYSGQDTAGKVLRNVASGGLVGTTPASMTGAAATWGQPGINTSVDASMDAMNMPSWVLYRFLMEDLTVSGRTYAQADAADLAAYNAALLTSGGAFFGDTYTSPSTLA